MGRQLFEKPIQGLGLAVPADIYNPAGLVVQNHRQVAVALADRDLVDGKDAKRVKIRLAIMGLKIKFVDILDGLPIQLKVPGDVGNGHQLAHLVDLHRQPFRHPQVRVKKLQVLGTDAMALGTDQFTVLALQPDLGVGEVQITYLPPGPAVNRRGSLAA